MTTKVEGYGLEIEQQAEGPGAAPAGKRRYYSKADGLLYTVGEDGVESPVATITDADIYVTGDDPDGVTAGSVYTAKEPSNSVAANARGTGAVDLQQLRGSADQIASGDWSVLVGGLFNIVSGLRSFIGGGLANSATGDYTAIVGGERAVADRYGMEAYSAGRFQDDGDAQRVSFVARNVTVDGTSVTLMLDGSVERLTVPAGKALFANVTVAGILSDGSKAAHYIRKCAIKNVGGTTSLIGAVSNIGADVEDDANYDVAITADNTNNALQINVTGKESETVRWVAHIQGIEIAYGT